MNAQLQPPPPAAEEPVTYRVLEVQIERIRAFPGQPRKWFDPEEIRARAESLRAIGQQNPVTVERCEGDPEHEYELIDGESRLRSAREAGLTSLCCAVRSRPFGSVNEKHMAALVANFNRSDHTPMEISDALQTQSLAGRTQTDLGRAIGKSQLWVSRYMSLQRLHPAIQAMLHPTAPKLQRITPAVGFELARLRSEEQLQALRKARLPDGRVTLLQVKRTLSTSCSARREQRKNFDLLKVKVRQNPSAGASAPAMRDSHRMAPHELQEYTEAWQAYWLTFPAPRPDGHYLLLQVAYPPNRLRTVRRS